MQTKRGWGPRIAVWSVAGLIVVSAVLFAVVTVTLPGCTFCHKAQHFVQQTASSPHSDMDCIRCHVSPGVPSRMAFAYGLVFGMTLRITPVGASSAIAVPDSTCLSCHRAVLRHKVTRNGLSILHSQCAKKSVCTDCHSDTAHGRAVKWIKTVSMNACLECHNANYVRSNCTKCHEERRMEQRIDSGEWAVTHNANWRKTHGMGDLKTCTACHPDDYCQRCHGIPLPHDPNYIRTHPGWALEHKKDCAVCHRQRFCDDCHGMDMPHPDGFTPLHSTLVKRQGAGACVRCHVQDDCTKCHERHVHPGGAIVPPKSDVQ